MEKQLNSCGYLYTLLEPLYSLFSVDSVELFDILEMITFGSCFYLFQPEILI